VPILRHRHLALPAGGMGELRIRFGKRSHGCIDNVVLYGEMVPTENFAQVVAL